jgi:O-antigen ligase
VLEDGLWRSPLVGFSRETLLEDQKRANAADPRPGRKQLWRHFHNELLDTLMTKGLIGAAVLLLLFFSAFGFFGRRIWDVAPEQRMLGLLGVVVLLEFAIFSLTDIQFQINAVRSMFVFVVVSLASLILAGEQERTALASLERPAVT